MLTESPVSGYKLVSLQDSLAKLGCGLFYAPVMKSTMEKAVDCKALEEARGNGFERAVVLTDHQTEGHGRFGREWWDEAGLGIEFTLVEGFDPEDGDPLFDSLYPSRAFATANCMALQEGTGISEIGLRWLDDLSLKQKKLGGHLVYRANSGDTRRPYISRFGVGCNVNNTNSDSSFPDTDYGAISLFEVSGNFFDRQELVLRMVEKWCDFRPWLKNMGENEIGFLDTRWQDNSVLKGRQIRVSGLTNVTKGVVVGKVIDLPIEKGLRIDTEDDGVIEVKEYGFDTRVEVVSE